MKFLPDVCVSSRSLTAALVAQGHDVVSALSIDPRASDDLRLDLALREGRVLITEDKDLANWCSFKPTLTAPSCASSSSPSMTKCRQSRNYWIDTPTIWRARSSSPSLAAESEFVIEAAKDIPDA